ncbi:hypothetical protein SCHPADRAFT_898371 [Schizopora paradoxa]|uniref:Uncharacterized protein n=1 Tax=Schizopora paradoxa TaxID=27342 RepID=A0A0H2S6C7_9AGAM|nr:hypothetical protein SCHPADRAFT_898371 [Schizopora paradoxa]
MSLDGIEMHNIKLRPPSISSTYPCSLVCCFLLSYILCLRHAVEIRLYVLRASTCRRLCREFEPEAPLFDQDPQLLVRKQALYLLKLFYISRPWRYHKAINTLHLTLPPHLYLQNSEMLGRTFGHVFAAIVALVATPTSVAQMVSFATPSPNQSLSPGENFIVQLDAADGLTGFEHISVAFGIQSCAAGCGNDLGNMLFAGNYTPTIHSAGEPMYQNFTLTVPSDLASGPSLLSVAHFYLIGAGLMPVLEMRNTTVTIAS